MGLVSDISGATKRKPCFSRGRKGGQFLSFLYSSTIAPQRLCSLPHDLAVDDTAVRPPHLLAAGCCGCLSDVVLRIRVAIFRAGRLSTQLPGGDTRDNPTLLSLRWPWRLVLLLLLLLISLFLVLLFCSSVLLFSSSSVLSYPPSPPFFLSSRSCCGFSFCCC